MTPVHFIEGLSVRYGFFRMLYRLLAPVYGFPRPLYYFGEDLFLNAVNPGNTVLELGSGTGFLTRMVRKKTGSCVGLERERAMAEKAASTGRLTRYVVGKMEHIPFKEDLFDRCISLGALHSAKPEEVADAVFQVLKDNGEFLLLTEAKIIPLFAPDSTPAGIRNALERKGFDVLEQKPIGRLYMWFRGRKRGKEIV